MGERGGERGGGGREGRREGERERERGRIDLGEHRVESEQSQENQRSPQYA